MKDVIMKFDFGILDWIQGNLRCAFLDRFFPAFTFLGEKGWFFILTAVILLCIPKTRKWGACLVVSLLLGLIFGNGLIKNMVGRTRPYDQVENFVLLVKKLSDYSFPSGHTLAAFEFLTVVCLSPVKRRVKVVAVLFGVMMAFSRLYLYVHFPTDILCAVGLGILFGVMGVRIVDMILEERGKKKECE